MLFARYTEIASSLVTGFPAILLVQVTVALGVIAYGVPLEIRTGCAPTSVGLMENTIVPVKVAVVVSVMVEMTFPGRGAAALLITSKHN